MKRFWRSVTVADAGAGWQVRLDDRTVNTPGRVPLALPTERLADAVAREWDAVGDRIDPAAMRLTGLANAAIDRIAPEPAGFAAGIAAYAASDLLCYRADAPPPLVARQQAVWDPLLDWARRRYDVHFVVTTGVMHVDQPAATLVRLSDAVAARPAFVLAPLSSLVRLSGSLVIGLALAEGAVDAATGWAAAQVDEDWQTEQWGEDSLAAEARAGRRMDFDAAVRFLALLDDRG